MDMQDKMQKISLYVFLCYFIFVLFSVFVEIPNFLMTIINILVVSELYGSRIIIYYITKHKISIWLITLFFLYIGWYCFQFYFSTTAWEGNHVITLLIAYIYIIVADKMTTGKISKRILSFSIFFISIEFIKILFSGTFVTVAATISQAVVILLIVDPILNNFAKNGAKKREESGIDTKQVPLIRKILFGKTGKIRTDFMNR